MSLTRSCYFFMLALLLTSCKFNCSVGGDNNLKAKTVTSNDNTALTGAIIKNDIDIEASGVKIAEVYLMDEDRNFLKENVARLGQRIYMVVKADTGWVKVNGKSFLGASERIMTSEGRVIVDAADVFKEYETTGLPADQAALLNLSAVITKADPGVEKFVVQFRIWDKKGNAEVTGRYKFNIRN